MTPLERVPLLTGVKCLPDLLQGKAGGLRAVQGGEGKGPGTPSQNSLGWKGPQCWFLSNLPA